jgi:hypothetical protein
MAPTSYHLAVTVDDAAQGVTHVIRGAGPVRRDRRASPAPGAARPADADLSTITICSPGRDGKRLAKRRRRAQPCRSARRGNRSGEIAGGTLTAGYSAPLPRIGRHADILIILILAAAGATAFVLVKGVIGMAQGKDVSGVRSQDLMRKRVMFQALAIVLVVLLLLVANGGRS